MLGREEGGVQIQIPCIWWWQTRAGLTGYLQGKQRFRKDPLKRQRYALLLNEDDKPNFYWIKDDGTVIDKECLLSRVELDAGPRIGFCNAVDLS